MEDEDEVIEIPRKLLEQIYQDYIMFRYCYFSELQEEEMKMFDEDYMQSESNEQLDEVYSKIKFYLKK